MPPHTKSKLRFGDGGEQTASYLFATITHIVSLDVVGKSTKRLALLHDLEEHRYAGTMDRPKDPDALLALICLQQSAILTGAAMQKGCGR